MQCDLQCSLEILTRTPSVLRALLEGISTPWSMANYGPETFSPFDVVGHLINGEKTDWMLRVNWMREKGASEPFPPFDRFAQVRGSEGKTMAMLLDEFELLRKRSLDELNAMRVDESMLDLRGLHPKLGAVTLRQLLATWVVHDLNHLAQIAKAMSFQYMDAVGPWRVFLPILPRE